jgi:hypothetical protein
MHMASSDPYHGTVATSTRPKHRHRTATTYGASGPDATTSKLAFVSPSRYQAQHHRQRVGDPQQPGNSNRGTRRAFRNRLSARRPSIQPIRGRGAKHLSDPEQVSRVAHCRPPPAQPRNLQRSNRSKAHKYAAAVKIRSLDPA